MPEISEPLNSLPINLGDLVPRRRRSSSPITARTSQALRAHLEIHALNEVTRDDLRRLAEKVGCSLTTMTHVLTGEALGYGEYLRRGEVSATTIYSCTARRAGVSSKSTPAPRLRTEWLPSDPRPFRGKWSLGRTSPHKSRLTHGNWWMKSWTGWRSWKSGLSLTRRRPDRATPRWRQSRGMR